MTGAGAGLIPAGVQNLVAAQGMKEIPASRQLNRIGAGPRLRSYSPQIKSEVGGLVQAYVAVGNADVDRPICLIKRSSDPRHRGAVAEIQRLKREWPQAIEVLAPDQPLEHLDRKRSPTADFGRDLFESGQCPFFFAPVDGVLHVGAVPLSLVKEDARPDQIGDVRNHPLLAGVAVEVLPQLVHVSAKAGQFVAEQRHTLAKV